jgi:hypothetical protein
MDLWQILVLGIVRLGLDADWDRLEHIANYDALVRQRLNRKQLNRRMLGALHGEIRRGSSVVPPAIQRPSWRTH